MLLEYLCAAASKVKAVVRLSLSLLTFGTVGTGKRLGKEEALTIGKTAVSLAENTSAPKLMTIFFHDSKKTLTILLNLMLSPFSHAVIDENLAKCSCKCVLSGPASSLSVVNIAAER